MKKKFIRGMAILMAGLITLQSPLTSMRLYAEEPASDISETIENGSDADTEMPESADVSLPETEETETALLVESTEASTETESIAKESIVQTESELSESERAAQTESEVLNNEETVREPGDITDRIEEITLSLIKLGYKTADKDGNISEGVTQAYVSGNLLDISSEEAEKIVDMKMEVGFDFLKPEESRDVRNGDTFTYNLSGSGLIFENTTAPVPVYNRQSLDSDVATDVLLGSYTIENGILKVTLSDIFTQDEEHKANLPETIIGRIDIPAALDTSILNEDEPVLRSINFWQQAEVTLKLPKAHKEETEPDKTKEALFAVGKSDVVPGADKTVSMSVEWLDNNNVAGIRPDLSKAGLEKALVQITYTIEGEAEQSLDSSHLAALGLSSMPELKSRVSGVGYETLSMSLPSSITVKDAEGADVKKTVSYKMEETGDTAWYEFGYQLPEKAPDNRWRNIISTSFNMSLDIKQGLGTKTWEDFAGSILLHLSDGSTKTLSECDVEVVGDDAGKTVLKINKLPAYTEDGVEIVYYVTSDDKLLGDAAGDYFERTYLNEASGNFGTNTVELHEGGTLRLILMGETSYEATKYWLDDLTGQEEKDEQKKAERPGAAVYLWRYSQREAYEDSNFKTASQVKDVGSQNIIQKLDVTKDMETIDFKDSLNGMILPKYDPEGYAYVYFLREVLAKQDGNADYEQVFGEVAPDGTVADALPVGYGGETRLNGDKSVYNTGVLSNRRNGQTKVSQKKTWEAAAHQNELKDVTVTLTLQKKSPGEDWEDTGIVQSMTGFIAEAMTKEVSADVPLYDEFGQTLEYRWVESAITETVDGVQQNIVLEAIGNDASGNPIMKFELSHNKNASDGKEWYESSVEDGVIFNRLKGETNYTVDKLWAKVDASGNIVLGSDGKAQYGKDAPEGASISVQILQDNKVYAENEKTSFVLDGVIDDENHEYTPYSLHFLNLPKFDKRGHKYTYVAQETSSYGGWHSDYSYNILDEDEPVKQLWDCQIKNTPVGEGKAIRLKKEWLDDGDVQHRGEVVVDVYRKKQAGESEDHYFGQAKLNADNQWWCWFGVTERDDSGNLLYAALPLDQYYIRELTVGGNQVYDSSNQPIEAGEAAAPSSSTRDYVVSEQHRYESFYKTDGNYLTAVNRRVGLINLTLTKKWVDEGSDARPDAKLALKIVEEGYERAINTTNNTVQLDNDSNVLPILKSDTSSGQAIYDVNTDVASDSYRYEFFNLPKYDGLGRIVHYTVDETFTGDSGDYNSSITEESYTIGERHSDDAQTMTIENRRSAVKSIMFHKIWKDAYVFEVQKKRPDIYLTLWRQDTVNNDGKPCIMEEYKDRLWKPTTEGVNADYYWDCDFGNLPRYDDNGAEIIYYATEAMHVNGRAFDYEDVLLDDDHRTMLDDTGAVVTDEALGKQTILKEDGTFTNQISNSVEINGKKVWKNVPDAFPNEELPKLRIIVKQKVEGETDDKYQEIAFTESLMGTGKQLDFTLKYYGENKVADDSGAIVFEPDGVYTDEKELPKYDDGGHLYDYTVTEEVIDDGTDLSTAYEKLPGAVNDYRITNTYVIDTKNVGYLKVKKIWDTSKWTSGTPVYPVLKFTLERRYEKKNVDESVTGDERYSEWENADEKELNCNEAAPTGGTSELIFEKLLVDAANGNPYQYRIKESAVGQMGVVDGYTVQVLDGDKNSTDFAKVDSATASSYISGIIPEVSKDDNPTAAATFKNTYNEPEESTKLSGEKQWKDSGNAFGLRPDSITLTVKRYANAQPGKSNNIGTKSNPEPNFTRLATVTKEANEKPGDSNAWTYSVDNLEKYAPNSMPWQYIAIENASDNTVLTPTYNNGKDITVTAKSTSSGIIMNPLINNGEKSVSVTKMWVDGSNPDNLRPSSITMKLQIKIGNGTDTWEDASTVFNLDAAFDALRDALTKQGFADLDNIQLTSAGAVNKSTWKTTSITGLPAFGKSAEGTAVACSYRLVETAVGNITLSIENDSLDNYIYQDSKPYTPSFATTFNEGSGTADKTVVTNTLADEKELSITKKWGDQSNLYNTRQKVTLTLLRSTSEDGPFEAVKDIAGNNVTREIDFSRTDEVTKTWDKLPGCDGDWNPYFYRVEETPLLGYQSPENVYNTDGSQTITNNMDTINLQIDKNWAGEPNTAFRPDTVELSLYRKIAGGNLELVKQYGVGGSQTGSVPTPNWTKDAGNNLWTCVYTGLPRSDKNGKPYTYSVKETRPQEYKKPVISDWEKISGDGNLYQINITNSLAVFSVDKTNDQTTPQPLNGVHLIICDKTGVVLAEWERNVEGKETVKEYFQDGYLRYEGTGNQIYGLPNGEYTLRETTTPVGYQNAGEIPFVIEDTGTGDIQIKVKKEDAPVAISPDGLSLTLKDTKTKFFIDKQWVDEHQIKDGSVVKGALAGAELTVFDETGSQPVSVDGNVLRWITDGSRITVEGLPTGTYTLKETKTPDGYATAADILFTLDDTNKVTVAGITVPDENGGAVLAVDDPVIYGTVKLVKTDKDNGQPLPGIKFSLYRQETGGTDELVKDDIITDSLGIWDGKDLPLKYGSYYFVETETLPDYTLDTGRYAFDITGEIKTETSGDSQIIVVSQPQQKVKDITNEAFETYVTLIKADDKDTSHKLEGVQFTLYKVENAGEMNESLTEKKVLTTDSNGRLHDANALNVALAEKGTYVLKETKPADGYMYDKDAAYTARFTVDNTDEFQGKCLVLADKVSAVAEADYQLSIENAFTGTDVENVVNERIIADIRLTKTSTAGESGKKQPLEGVIFELWQKADESHGIASDRKVSADGKDSFATDENGQLTVKGLDFGTYYFKEIQTLEDKLLESGQFPENGITIGEAQHQTIVDVSMENKDFKTYIDWYKQDADNQNFLKDTVYTLYRENGDSGEYEVYGNPATTDDNGYVKITVEHSGKYKLMETKPSEGYVKDTRVIKEFTVDNTEVFYEQTVHLGTFVNSKTHVEILKQSAGDTVSIGLPGAKMVLNGHFTQYAEELVKDFGGELQADGTIQWITSDSAFVLDGVLIAGETYELTETQAPEGYIAKNLPSVKLTMDENGTLVPGEAAGVSIDESGKVTVLNNPVELKIQKFGADTKQPLKGCIFAVTGVFAPARNGVQSYALRTLKSAEEKIVVDDEHPDVLKGRLIVGNTYTLEELTPPDGYEVGGSVRFTVEADGTIRMEASSEYAYKKDEATGQMMMTMEDAPIEVKLLKTDLDGKPISGAEFDIEGIFAGSTSVEKRHFTVDKDGLLNLSKMLVESKEGESYTLTETKAPDGYVLLEQPVSFKVKSGGIVVLDETTVQKNAKDTAKLSEADGIYTITIANRKVETPEKENPSGKDDTNKGSSVGTGDWTNLTFGWMALLVSGAALIYAGRRRRRKNN